MWLLFTALVYVLNEQWLFYLNLVEFFFFFTFLVEGYVCDYKINKVFCQKIKRKNTKRKKSMGEGIARMIERDVTLGC